jgi:hypothetical protein
MSYFGIDPYSGTSELRGNARFNISDRFEFETSYEGRRITHRGRITKIERFDSFQGFLDNGSFICGNTHSLNKIPKSVAQISKNHYNA